MQPLNFVRSRCVVRNNGRGAIKLLGRATLPPDGGACDLFDIIPNLSEIIIVDALRQPSGELYQKKMAGQIEILECDLVIFNNANVKPIINTVNVSGNNNVAGVANIVTQAPLEFENGLIKMHRANEFNDGFLSKFDFIEFKNHNFKLTVWQYQDFTSVDGIDIKLTEFNNFKFDASSIVNGSAFVVNADKQNELIYSISRAARFFGGTETVKVQNHIKNTVLLDRAVPKNKNVRVYFLVSALLQNIGENKILPVVPDIVRKARIELVDATTVENGRAGVVVGEKRFINKTIFTKVGIGCEPGNVALNVDGTIKSKKLSVTDGAKAGHFLMSNSLGDGNWQSMPLISEEKPEGSINGALWFKIPENALYYFNSEIMSWLSVDSEFINLRGSAISISNTYLDLIDNGYAQAPNIVKLFDCMITDLEFEGDVTAPLAIEFHINGSLIPATKLEIFDESKKYLKNINVFLKAGAVLKLYVNGSNIVKPKVKLKIKAVV